MNAMRRNPGVGKIVKRIKDVGIDRDRIRTKSLKLCLNFNRRNCNSNTNVSTVRITSEKRIASQNHKKCLSFLQKIEESPQITNISALF